MGALLWAVGGLAGVLVVYLAYVIVRTLIAGASGRKPEGLTATADLPGRAKVGDQIRLTLRVTNTLGRPRVLTNTDLQDALVEFTLRARLAGMFAGSVTAYVDGDHYRWIDCPVSVEIEG